MRSGFACFVGRPNVGKSTLLNRLVGTKVAITSTRPQTTRNVVRGVVNRDGAQLVVVDTPGLHRPRTLLGERLNDLVRGTIGEVDVVGACFPADERTGPGDRFLAAEIATLAERTPAIAVLTKVDLVASRDALAERLVEVSGLADWAEVVPVSAVTGYQVDLLADLLVDRLPEGPAYYPDGELTDAPEQTMVADLVREAALDSLREELPHSLAVVVEEMTARPDGLVRIEAVLFVERDSQRPILLGAGGSRLKHIGTTSRRQIEALLGARVHLDLRVKVAKEWQRDPKQLRRLGF